MQDITAFLTLIDYREKNNILDSISKKISQNARETIVKNLL